MGLHTVGPVTYELNDALKRLWDRNSLESMKRHNSDRCYIVDGRERSGKSTWAFQQMGYIEPNTFSSIEEFKKRVCFTAEQFNKACRELTNSVIIFDEAFRGLSSRAALSKINKMIVQTLMEMGQNNNIVFIVLPRIFLLDVYPAMLRSNGLFHIDFDKKRRYTRRWMAFNEQAKNKIYEMGTRKGWGYPAFSPMRGTFSKKFPGGDDFEKAYRDIKMKAFQNMPQEEEVVEKPMGIREKRAADERNKLIESFFGDYDSVKEAYEEYTSKGGTLSYPLFASILSNSQKPQ